MKRNKKESVELLLDGGGPFIVWLDEGDGGPRRRGFLINPSFCDNFDCPCRDISLDAVLVDERYTDIEIDENGLHYRFVPWSGEAEPVLRRLAATLDVDTGEIQIDDRAPLAHKDFELLAWLQERTLDSYMPRLRKRWRHAKGYLKDAWRSKDWTWWEPGRLVSWFEIYPDDTNLILQMDGDVYLADDMYCINPGCSCKEVGLGFSKITEAGIERLGAIRIEMPSCRLSSIMDGKAKEETLRRLLDVFLQMRFPNVLNDRLKMIQPVGKQIVALSTRKGTPSIRSVSKVGRNDPCPCGSGKKYKKCCLGKS